MKNISIVCLALIAFACKNSEPQYKIAGEIKGKSTNISMVYLKTTDGTDTAIDSSQVNSGKFSMTGHVPYTEFYKITDAESQELTTLYIENTGIDVAIDVDHWEQTKIISPTNDLMAKYGELASSQWEIIAGLYKQLTVGDQTIVLQMKEEYRKDSLMKIAFINENINSPVVASVLNSSAQTFDFKAIQEIISRFNPDIMKTADAKRVTDFAETMRKVQPGKEFTNFTALKLDGTQGAFADYAGKGKYTVLNFWASWCKPCRATKPMLKELYSKYKKDLDIVSFSLDTDQGVWEKTVLEDELTWQHLSDLNTEGQAAQTYAIRSIPSLFLLDKDGVILASHIDIETLAKELDKRLR